jgi:hypothetical protein
MYGNSLYDLKAFKEVLKDFSDRYAHCTNMTIVLRFNHVRTQEHMGDWGIYTKAYALHYRGVSELPRIIAWHGQRDKIQARLSRKRRNSNGKKVDDIKRGKLPKNIRFSLTETFPLEEVERDMSDICDMAEDPYLPCRCKEDVAMAKKVFDEGA